MKLTISFQALINNIYKMGVTELVEFRLEGIGALPPIATSEGIRVSIDDVVIDPKTKVFLYNNKHVLLFIPDHTYSNIFYEAQSDPSKGNKFHLTDCSTLTNMKQKNRFRRYYVTTNPNGYFKIYGNNDQSAIVRLLVCQNCLKALNYPSSPNNFNLSEFFKHYETNFIAIPNKGKEAADIESVGYTKDWANVSEQYRKSRHYICENCGVELINYPYLLHTHHKDGNKTNNNYFNLKAVCEECHSKEESHSHMQENISAETLHLLQKLREEQRLIKALSNF